MTSTSRRSGRVDHRSLEFLRIGGAVTLQGAPQNRNSKESAKPGQPQLEPRRFTAFQLDAVALPQHRGDHPVVSGQDQEAQHLSREMR